MFNKKNNVLRIFVVFFIIVATLSLTGCSSDSDSLPLNGFFDESNLLGWFFVYPIGFLMSVIGKLFNGSYGVAIVVTTIILRFALFPIYAGTSNLGLNMQLAQPDLEKLNAKYAGRTDQESMALKQAEMVAIYKKYNVNFKSCLAQPIQMGVFFGMTRALNRIIIAGGSLTLTNLTLFGLSLAGSVKTSEYGIASQIFSGFLVVVVAATQFGIVKIGEKYRPKTAPKKQTSEFAGMFEKQMKLMILIMPLWLAFLASGSTAYALYWAVGNTCSLIITIINGRNMNKKREAHGLNNPNKVDILDKNESTFNDTFVENPFDSIDNKAELTDSKNDIIDVE